MSQSISSDSRNRRAALAVACAGSFMTPYLSSAVSVALPATSRDLGLDAVALGWVNTAFLVAAAACLLPFGKLADMVGRRRIYAFGVGFYTLFSALAGLAPNGAILIASMALSGASAAMIFGTGVAILTSVYAPRERGRVLGINVAFTYAGLSLGPVFGGFLTHAFGWRSVYLLNVPIGLIALFFAIFRLEGEWRGEEGQRFDFGGSLSAFVTLGALVFGLSLLPSPTGLAAIAASLIGLLIFVRIERRAAFPLLSLSLFEGNRAFGMSNLAALVNYSATFALTFFLSLYLQYDKGMTPEASGLLLVAQPVFMVIFSPIAGRLSDRVEPRILASAGMAIMTVMLAVFAMTLDARTPVAAIALELVAVGIGYAFFSSPNTNAVMGAVTPKHYGVASATLGTMRLVGQMISMGIAMLVIDLFVGRSQITPTLLPQFQRSLSLSLAIFAALCLFGVFASMARGDRATVAARG